MAIIFPSKPYFHIPTRPICVEVNGRIVGSSSSLIVSLKSNYADHTWNDITGQGLFKNHNPNGDSLYGADISVHPKFRIGALQLSCIMQERIYHKMNLRRIIAGGRYIIIINMQK